ncbi:MAG: hypothetical protein JNL21_03120 [Myxococcales bacterium]|nr:hypothetical protein [Myxococcales bacterium]
MSDSDSKRDPEPRARRSNRPPGRGYEVGVAPASAPVPTRRSPPEPDRLRRIARGPVLLAIDAEVERRFGDDGRERVVALLPDAHADELRRGRPSALEAHDIDAVRIYLEIASRVLGIDAATFQDFGRVAVDRELAPFVKTLVLPGSLPDVLRRCVTIVSRFLSFGVWTVVKSTPELGTIRVEDVGVLSPLLRSWYLGVIEGIVRRSVSPDAVVVDTSSVDAGPSVLEIEIELDTPPSRLSGSPVSSHPGS